VSQPRTRSRSISSGPRTAKFTQLGGQVVSRPNSLPTLSTAEVISDGNRFRFHGSRDSGGPFIHLKQTVSRVGGSFREWPFTKTNIVSAELENCVAIPSFSEGDVNPLSLSPAFSSNEMTAFGATGWARFKPTKPLSGVANFLGELKDIPRIPGVSFRNNPSYYMNRTRYFKNLGSEYLNVQFGWIPFLRDLQQMLRVTQRSVSLYNQILRDNGKPIRRRGTILSDKGSMTIRLDSNPAGTTYVRPTLGSPWFLTTANTNFRRETVQTTTKVWFSGRFRYYLSSNATIRNIQIADRLFGIAPSPSLVWSLTPWSWLIDWFTNVGDNISNLSDFASGLVADYAYVMAERRTTSICAVEVRLSNNEPMRFVTTKEVLSQQRQGANPFGFGLNYSGLNLKQLSILAALGFTKLND